LKKIKKGAQTNASIGARGFCYKESFKLKRYLESVSISSEKI